MIFKNLIISNIMYYESTPSINNLKILKKLLFFSTSICDLLQVV